MKMRVAIVALAVAMAAAGSAWAEPAAKREVCRTIGYDVTEHVHSADDDRTILVQIGLMNGDYAWFSYREDVHGATTATVRAIKYETASDTVISAAQMDALLKALSDAGIGSLKDDAFELTDYSANLHVTFGNRRKDLHFDSPPSEGARLAVHKVLLDFVHQLDIDGPKQAGAETISEGDSVPAQAVELRELLAHPETYDGKRMRLTGYYHGELEGLNICVDKMAADRHDYDQCLWHGEASTFANADDLDIGNDRWETIDGVFFKGPGGHLGLWPGSVERLTRVKPLVPAKKP